MAGDSEMEKIRLGFDEDFLEQELSRAHASFESFADSVRTRIDSSIFSEDALKRMYVANERLNLYMESMRKVEQAKAAVAQTDEVMYRRYEAQQSHMQAGIQREAAEYERARRDLPTQPYGSRAGVTGGAGGADTATQMGMAVLGGTGQLAAGVLGFQVGGLLSSANDVRKAYKGRYDPKTEEHVVDPAEKAAAWGDFTKKAVELTVGQAIKGFEIVKQQDQAYRLAAQAAGRNEGLDRFMGTSDTNLIDDYGMSRLQAIPLMTRLARATGGNGDWESVLKMERGFGGGNAAADLLGAAARRGEVGATDRTAQEELIAKAVGAGTIQGLRGARMVETLEALTTEMRRGYGKFDADTMLQTAIDLGKVSEQFKGAGGADVISQLGGLAEGGGRGVAMTVAMQGGLNYADARRAVESGNYFNTAQGKAGLARFLRGLSPDMQSIILAQLGFKMPVADAVRDILDHPGSEVAGAGAAGRAGIAGQIEDVAPMEELKQIGEKTDLPAITLGEGERRLLTSKDRHSAGYQRPLSYTERREHAAREAHFRNVSGSLGIEVPAGRHEGTTATLSNDGVRSAFQEMAAAFQRETGSQLRLAGSMSGDRTAEQRLSAWLKRRAAHPEESEAESRQWAAQKHSRHEDGMAIDVMPDAVAWMKRNAGRFGFSHPSRLGSNDPVHFEYDKPEVTNQTTQQLEVSVVVKPAQSAEQANDAHKAQTHERYTGGQHSLFGPGPGTLLGGHR